jgi:hypothetical protein
MGVLAASGGVPGGAHKAGVVPMMIIGDGQPNVRASMCDREGAARRPAPSMNEWGFCGQIKSWWDSQFSLHPTWNMALCELEREDPARDRSDLAVLTAAGDVVLVGEMRLPDHGSPSPWHLDNLSDAFLKARRRRSRWAFTSDGVDFLLLDTTRPGSVLDCVVSHERSAPFTLRSQLDDGAFLNGPIRDGWIALLANVAPVVAGLTTPAGMAPDAIFIETLRALLASPVAAVHAALEERRAAEPTFADDLIRWMVDVQGWVHEPSQWIQETRRTAQLACYVFVTRLLFYEALRRAQPTLPVLELSVRQTAGASRSLFDFWFREAREKSGDYRTLFDWDRADDMALMSDGAVPGWSRIIDHLGLFDLATVGYDIMGRVFERLIEPSERYRWGQHYTQPDVVDLMLSFASPDGQGPLLDPAAGGGTFLVRAYERKAWRDPAGTHQDRLRQLFGIDVSTFAATLSTINLAARRLSFEDNYPQIIAKSFFRVGRDDAFMRLPQAVLGLDTDEVTVHLPRFAAIACNPPYVRRQLLDDDRLQEINEALGPTAMRTLHRLSNYHVYFWIHAHNFLADDGRLAFITAGEWLDSDYGVALQRWLLDRYALETVIESHAEPWFTEARVGTVVLTAKKCNTASARCDNLVRFVTLRQPLAALYATPEDESDRLNRVDRLRDRLLALPEGSGESDLFDWTVIRQSELEALGMGPSEGTETG